MEDSFYIKGGRPLIGHVQLSGAKNIALKVLTAALLFQGKVVLENIPRIKDIVELLHLFNLLGVKAAFTEKNTVEIDSSTFSSHTVDLLHASKIRASFLLFAPILYRFGEAHIPNPGGCRLGARSIDRIVEGLAGIGIQITYDSATGYYDAKMPQKPQGVYRFQKSTHTGTELMIMMSVFSSGTIRIENAALEPEIDDLIGFLNAGGANIKRVGNDVEIQGVDTLLQKNPYKIAPDRVEAATFAVLAIASHGDITISSLPEAFIKSFVDTIEKTGAGVEKINDQYRFFYKPFQSMIIETTPHPGFLTDWQPMCALLMTQASGKSIIHERIFENRFSYVSELRKVGAEIEYVSYPDDTKPEHYFFNYDPEKEYTQTIEVTGPQTLHGGVLTVADLRAGATLAAAALIAEGESYVTGISHLERGYENFVEKVQALGGEIRKI